MRVVPRLALSGELLRTVMVEPDWLVHELCQAIADAAPAPSPSGFRRASEVRIFAQDPDGSDTTELLPEGATLRDAGLADGCEIRVLRRPAPCIATSSNDNRAALWSELEEEPVASVLHFGQVYATVFSPDGSLFVTSSEDFSAKICNTDSAEAVHTLRGHTGEVYSAVFSPDGQRVVTASGDSSVRVWSVESGATEHVWSHKDAEVTLATFSADGRLVLSAGTDGVAGLFDLDLGGEAQGGHLRGHRGAVARAEFSADGQLAVTASEDRTAKIWKVTDSTCLHTLAGHTGKLIGAAFNSAGSSVVTCSEDRSARLWDVATGAALRVLEGHTDVVYTAHFSPNGQLLVTTAEEPRVLVWRVGEDTPPIVLEHGEGVGWSEFSPDGQLLATGDWSNTGYLWCPRTGTRLRIFEGHAGAVNHITFSC